MRLIRGTRASEPVQPAPAPVGGQEAAAADSDESGAKAGYSLGPEIATRGTRAAGVFAASSRVGSRIDGRTAIVVTDTPDLLAGLPPGVVGVSLSQLPPSLSVPAFDPEHLNPIGWKPDHGSGIAASRAASGTDPPSPASMRRAHHIEDWTSSQDDAAARAGELAAAAATGVVVCVRTDNPELKACLGGELYGLMADSARIAEADSHQREALSIAMRRAALRDHSLRARARQVLAAAGLESPTLPLVSVLVPTRRPDLLHDAIAAVEAQTYPHVELVLALHGDGFEHISASLQLDDLRFPARAVRVPEDRSLGAVLNEALAVSGGAMIAKFDDDDLYGPHHLWDLVLAAEYSGADLVGKTSEYVYLAVADRTVRRFVGFGERYIDPMQHSVTGAAMLISRQALKSIGGWRPMGVGEDKTLAQDIGAAGGTVYRTHGTGFLAIRHGAGHTWEVDDSYFLKQAQDGRDGFDLRFAGIV